MPSPMCWTSTRSSTPRRSAAGVEALGSEMIGKLTYYERWIAAFANILFQKGILTPGELAQKMEEVRARDAPGREPERHPIE